MEEAAQILEVETFVPLLLQEPNEGVNRLKRWIMIGDHHQLPPVVQNVAYQKYSNMEQSLFSRFIRLGVPHVQLDAQGRARAEIAALYNWRYKGLGDLPHIKTFFEFLHANPGFQFTYQFIDVSDFNGVGESTPSPYFYQVGKILPYFIISVFRTWEKPNIVLLYSLT
jgi:intron-binding protein aquarius